MHSTLPQLVPAVILSLVVLAPQALAQGGLRDSLTKLDRNEDGVIDPDEITPLARPYLERIARAKRLSLYRSNDISEFQEAARIYYALQNGVSGESVRATPDNILRTFYPEDEMELVPGFGLAEIKYSYTQEDVEEAERTMRRCDADDNGFIDRREARRNKWTHRDPFEEDYNGDNLLSLMELTQRYARRRMLEDDAGELVQRARRVGNGIEPSRKKEERRDDRGGWWRSGGSSYWLTASMIGRFDTNRNGRLESNEAKELGLPIGSIDVDRDGEVTRDELFQYTQGLQDAAGDPGEGLPGWFFELDKNRDDQVTMPEFSDEWTEQRIQEFSLLDSNGDGLLTANEIRNSKALMGGSFAMSRAELLPPRKTIVSELEVPEDIDIGDVNVQLSITHTSTGFLDAFLVGPDETRIELFTAVGGSGDHFQRTIIDDESSTPITKGRSPFEGSFMSEGKAKRQPGLEKFNGKNAKGVWQLVIHGTRSERFGMLHEWKLIFRPKNGFVGDQFFASVTETASNPGPAASPPRQEQPEKSYRKESSSNWSSEKRSDAAQAWVNSGGPEQIKRRQEALDRYSAWAEKQKAEGKEITGEGKKQFFGEFSKGDSKGDKKSEKKRYDKESIEKYKRFKK